MKQSVIGLGSNQGDRVEFLKRAIWHLRAHREIRILAHSPIYESDALVPENAPPSWGLPFLNMAVLIETSKSPHQLLNVCKKIEKETGRIERERWAPREIDLDILTFEGENLKDESLNLPHSELPQRPFALLPLRDLDPDLETAPHFREKLRFTLQKWRERGVPFRTQRTAYGLTQIVGVLNVTPDSFSDGGEFLETNQALRRFHELQRSGVHVIDIGAESTRPGSERLHPDLEWKRLEPVLEALKQEKQGALKFDTQISLDTCHAQTLCKALPFGVDWINDVTGFEDSEMLEVVKDSSSKLVVMHQLGVPPEPGRTLPESQDPVQSLLDWGFKKIEKLQSKGIDPSRIILDPGLGFGKTAEQHREILSRIHRFHDWGVSVLVGHSRKSFLSRWFPKRLAGPAHERDTETLALSLWLSQKGIDYVRVHDVDSTFRAFSTQALVQNRFDRF